MRERPILFSAPMVKAILAGTKTQTRRALTPSPPDEWNPVVGVYHPTKTDRSGEEYPGEPVFGASDERIGVVCKYGRPGDHLWVKETWASVDHIYGCVNDPPEIVTYRADQTARQFGAQGGAFCDLPYAGIDAHGHLYREIPIEDRSTWGWDRAETPSGWRNKVGR